MYICRIRRFFNVNNGTYSMLAKRDDPFLPWCGLLVLFAFNDCGFRTQSTSNRGYSSPFIHAFKNAKLAAGLLVG
jgi:hypothetical protein